MRHVIVVAAVLLHAGVSAAEAPAKQTESKSVETAAALSLGVTAAGLAVIVGTQQMIKGNELTEVSGAALFIGASATFLGPTAGHLYVGTLGTPGLTMRLIAVPAALIGGWLSIDPDCKYLPIYTGEPHHCPENPTETYGDILLVGAAALFVTGTVWDIATVHRAVERRNRRASTPLAVTPMMTRGNSLPGIAIVGTF